MSNKIRRFSKLVLPLALAMVLAFAFAAFASHSLSAMEPPPAQGPDQQATQAPAPIYRADGTIDVGPLIRNKDLPLDKASIASVQRQRDELAALGATQAEYNVGDTRFFLGLDNAMGFYFVTTYEVRLISDTVEVWVQSDLSYPSPVHPDSKDPQYVTDQRITELATAFEDVIRPTDVNYFGAYDSLAGTNAALPGILGLPEDYFETTNGQRTIILVQNVRDGNYYDPANNPSFIAGFFSPTFEFYADRNIITIDSKQWNLRVGPPNFGYEATIVHEMQHLINSDYDADEDSWANEGRSEFSEFIAGYRPDPESHRTTWSDYPENSLTLWGDQDNDPDQTFEILADYQQSYWFFLYLTGRLVDDAGMTVEDAVAAVAETTQDPENGVASIEDLLNDVSAPFDFTEVWNDFRIDVTYGGDSDGTSWGDYISTYSTQSSMSNAPLDLGRLRENLNFEGYDTPGAPPYGSDYIEIGWSPAALTANATLTAEVEIPTGWESIPVGDVGVPASGDVDGEVLYSGHTDLTDNFVIFEASVPSTGDQTLSFDTFYDIEETWDFGFVQVTTDTADAEGFTSLDITGMITETASGAHPVIAANVPGFSGLTSDWVHVEYDLSAYAGENILLAFRYATDWATGGNDATDPAPGWYIDNVSVGGTDLYVDSLPSTAMSIWQARDIEYDARFDIVTYADGNGDAINNVYSVPLTPDNGTLTGSFNFATLAADTGFNEANERLVALVSAVAPTAPDDLIGAPAEYLDYTLDGLPSSINTSRLRLEGTAAGSSLLSPAVYPGDTFSVTVSVDNLGRNDDLETQADATAYVAVPVPEHTTVADSGDFAFSADLSTIDPALPVGPGVHWNGTVTDSTDLQLILQADLPLTIGIDISTTAHIADGPFSAATQYFTETSSVEVESPLAFSTALAPTAPVPSIGEVSFDYLLVNTDDASREVDFHFTVPAGTSLSSISFGSRALSPEMAGVTASGEVLLTLDVPSFLETQEAMVVTVNLAINDDFSGDTVSLAPTVYQPDSQIPYWSFPAEDATATVWTNVIALPVIANE